MTIDKGEREMQQTRGHHDSQDISHIAEDIFNSDSEKLSMATDKIFNFLFIGQWVLSIIFAYAFAPKTTPEGSGSSNVWMGVLLGGLFASIPFILNALKPGGGFNRYVNVIAQSGFSILLTHLSAGRIETHFHVFGSLVLFAFYADIRVLAMGSLISIFDHFVRGVWFPESLFGAADASGLRWVEHVGWLLFASTVLFLYCLRVRSQMQSASMAKAQFFNQVENSSHQESKSFVHHESGNHSGVKFKEHLENISAALAEITGMVEANVRSAENVNSVAGEVHGVSESTRHVMEELTSAMQNILESNERIEKLVKIIEQVAEKTEVIDEIVFKTQLLSFNASVEAERAGEHGRGFAVVAQEVGNLAQMSGKAATEIASIVKNSIREADQVAAENKERVEKGGDLVAQTRDKTSGVLNRITEILHATDQIVAASKEQSQGISEITKSINMLSQSSGNNSSEKNEDFHKSSGHNSFKTAA